MKLKVSFIIFFFGIYFSIMNQNADSKTREVTFAPLESDFYMIVASDPQLYWACEPSNSFCLENVPGGDEKKQGAWANKWQVTSMNRQKERLGEKLKGVIINGDLTAFGHSYQYDAYLKFYEKELELKIWPGLGNHDIENNVNDCFQNNCAIRMAKYLKNKVKKIGVRSFDYYSKKEYQFPNFVKKYQGSFSYSWDIGAIHFIQLNNGPAYETTFEGWNFSEARNDIFKMRNSYEWLKKDLKEASAEGKKIIINMHQGYKDETFLSIIKNYPVEAIFLGHYHENVGEYQPVGTTRVFYSGASSNSTYLLVHFSNGKLENVEVINVGLEVK